MTPLLPIKCCLNFESDSSTSLESCLTRTRRCRVSLLISRHFRTINYFPAGSTDVDSLLSDSTKLDMLFAKLNINAHEKRELCVAFYEHFISSTTPDIYLKKISDVLSKIATEHIPGDGLRYSVNEPNLIVNGHTRTVFLCNPGR